MNEKDIAKQLKDACPNTHIFQIIDITTHKNEDGTVSVMYITREKINNNMVEYFHDRIYI